MSGSGLHAHLNINWSCLYVGSSRLLAEAQPASSQLPSGPQSAARLRASAPSATETSTPPDSWFTVRGVLPTGTPALAATSPSAQEGGVVVPGPGICPPMPRPTRGLEDSAKGGAGRDSAVQSSARMLVTMRLVEMMPVPPGGEEEPAEDLAAAAAAGAGGQTATAVRSSASRDDLPSRRWDGGCAAPAVTANIRVPDASRWRGGRTASGDGMTTARHVGHVLLNPTSHCRMHLHACINRRRAQFDAPSENRKAREG